MGKKKVVLEVEVDSKVDLNPFQAILLECKNGVAKIDEVANNTVTLAATDWISETLKYHAKRGKSQWWNSRFTDEVDLHRSLANAVNEHRYQDVMVLAAMLEFRLQGK